MGKDKFHTFCGMHVLFVSRMIASVCLATLGLKILSKFKSFATGSNFHYFNDNEMFSHLLMLNIFGTLFAAIYWKKRLLMFPFIFWNIVILYMSLTSFGSYAICWVIERFTQSYPIRMYGYRSLELWPIGSYIVTYQDNIQSFALNLLVAFIATGLHIYMLRTILYTYLFMKHQEQTLPLQMENVYTNQVPILETENQESKKGKLEEVV